MRVAERRRGAEIVRSMDGSREIGHLNEGIWEAWVEREVTEDETREEDTKRGQGAGSSLRRGSQSSGGVFSAAGGLWWDQKGGCLRGLV